MAAIDLLVLLGAGGWFYRSRGGSDEAIDSFAVLPFVNASGDRNSEYLSDGITESLINSLSQLPHLRVMSRDSAFMFKGKDTDTQAVGRQLGVRAVFKGKVTQRGDNLERLVPNCGHSRRQSHLDDHYSRKGADIFALEGNLAKEMTTALRMRLSGEDEKRLARATPRILRLIRIICRGASGGTRDGQNTWFQALAELNSGHIVTAAEYAPAVAAGFGTNAPAVLDRYPLSNYQTPSNALAASAGDRGLICGSRRATRLVSRFVPTYAYEFNVRDTPIATPSVSFPYLAAHTGEIPYLFPGFHGATGPLRELNKAQTRLATQMVQYWTTFARTGTPNSKSKSPPWPRYEERLDNYEQLELPVPVTLTGIGDEHHCDFWDSLDK